MRKRLHGTATALTQVSPLISPPPHLLAVPLPSPASPRGAVTPPPYTSGFNQHTSRCHRSDAVRWRHLSLCWHQLPVRLCRLLWQQSAQPPPRMMRGPPPVLAAFPSVAVPPAVPGGFGVILPSSRLPHPARASVAYASAPAASVVLHFLFAALRRVPFLRLV